MRSSLRSLPARALEVARAEGVPGLRIRVLDATVYRHLLITGRPLEIPEPERAEVAAGLALSFLGAGELGDYASFRSDADPAETRRRIDAGHRCVAAWRGGRIVHARWIAGERLESAYLGLSFDLPPNAVYIYDVFTAPSARRQGISVAAMTHYANVLREEGVEIVLGSTWPGNAAAREMLRASRQEMIGTIGVIRLGPRRFPVRRRMPRAYIGAAHRFSPGGG